LQSPAQRLKLADRGAVPLAPVLIDRIRERGPLTFAECMEACLYHPQYGYYTKANQEPRRDYFTSADAGPIFGRLLARQFAEMWVLLGCPDPFWLAEAGAGRGELAKTILDFVAETQPDFYAALRYVGVERSELRRAGQARLLKTHAERERFSPAADLPEEIPDGCVFSNELLDALPVHRVIQEGEQLRELYVEFRDGGLCEKRGPLSSPAIAEYFARQGIELRDGQQAEAGLAACGWIRDAGRRLGRGLVLTIDYGREASDLYDERHMRGTLLAYKDHRASEEFFRAPGDQDLTAHVNFTALDLWGRESGLARVGLATQSNFLLAIVRETGLADIEPEGGSESEQNHRRLLFKTLINPEGMGESFQVFVQHKGIDPPPALTGLRPI
jgi:SAM-dependent MidA family methyltransferase